MYKTFPLLPLFLIVLLISGCGGFHLHPHPHGTANDLNELLGRYQSQTVVPDGSTNEWDKASLEFDGKYQISYTFTNDLKNLYILLTTNDSITRLNIINGGLTLLINPRAQTKAAASVYFPLNNQQGYKLAGFKSGNGSYSEMQDNKAGIQLNLTHTDHTGLVYEAIIPFASVLAGEDLKIDGREFSAGFSFNKALTSDKHEEVIIWRTFVLSPK